MIPFAPRQKLFAKLPSMTKLPSESGEEYVLLRELQILRIIDLGPGQTGCGAKSNVCSLIDQFLQSCIEEFVRATGPDQLVDPAEQLA